MCPNTLVKLEQLLKVELLTAKGFVLLFLNFTYLELLQYIYRLVKVNGLRSSILSPVDVVATGSFPNWNALILLEEIFNVFNLLKPGANSITSVVFVLSRFSSSRLGAPTKLILKLALLQLDSVTDLSALAFDTLNVANLLQLGA